MTPAWKATRRKSLATGATLPGAGKGWMVTDTVAMLESSAPSLALKVKVDRKSAAEGGGEVNAPVAASVTTAAPFAPFATIENVSASPFASDAANTPLMTLPS